MEDKVVVSNTFGEICFRRDVYTKIVRNLCYFYLICRVARWYLLSLRL